MKTERIWVGLLVLSLAVLIVSGMLLANTVYEKNNLERQKNNLERQLIAVCGVMDEVVSVPNLTISPADEPEEVISIKLSSLPEESFPWKNIFTIRSDGKIHIDKIGGWGERESEKSWKDYPKFAEIGKK